MVRDTRMGYLPALLIAFTHVRSRAGLDLVDSSSTGANWRPWICGLGIEIQKKV